MSDDSGYKPPGQLADLYRSSDNSPTTNQLDITSRVDQGVVRSTDADISIAAPAGWTFPVRNSSGMRIADPAAVTPEDIVSIGPGDETTVGNAMYLGLLTRNAAGHIVPVGAASAPQGDTQERQPEAQTQEPQPEPLPALDDASEALMSRAFNEASSETIGVAAALIYGSSSEAAAVEQLAARLNLEKGDAIAKVESVKAAYATEAYTVTAREVQTSPRVVEDALAAAQLNPATQSSFRRAAESHFQSGKPEYAQLVHDYIADLGSTDAQRILNANPVAGRSVRYDHASRQVLVKFPDGDEIPWNVAVKMQLISLK